MKILNQIADGVSRGNDSERPFLSGKKINLTWYSIFGILVLSWPLLQRFVTSTDQTVGYLDPNIWLLISLSLISFLLVVGLTWLLFHRFWVALGLPGLSTMVLQFKNLELWHQFAFYWLSFALLLLTATLCLMAIC